MAYAGPGRGALFRNPNAARIRSGQRACGALAHGVRKIGRRRCSRKTDRPVWGGPAVWVRVCAWCRVGSPRLYEPGGRLVRVCEERFARGAGEGGKGRHAFALAKPLSRWVPVGQSAGSQAGEPGPQQAQASVARICDMYLLGWCVLPRGPSSPSRTPVARHHMCAHCVMGASSHAFWRRAHFPRRSRQARQMGRVPPGRSRRTRVRRRIAGGRT